MVARVLRNSYLIFQKYYDIIYIENEKGLIQMKNFDDFDTQIQIDEIVDETVYHYFAEYPVDCDDGTIGDVIYEWVKSTPNFVGAI